MTGPVVKTYTFNTPTFVRQKQLDLFEFKGSPVYTVSGQLEVHSETHCLN